MLPFRRRMSSNTIRPPSEKQSSSSSTSAGPKIPARYWELVSEETGSGVNMQSLIKEYESTNTALYNMEYVIDTTETHQMMRFNGRNSFIRTQLATAQVTNITMSVWFRTDDPSKPGQMIFYNGSDAQRNGYGLALNSENDRIGMLRVLYGGVTWFDTRTFISDKDWHHAALIIRANGSPELYLDGRQVYVGESQFPNIPQHHTEIGRNDYPSAPRYFHGNINGATIWNTDLPSVEISVLYCQELPKYQRMRNLKFVELAMAVEVSEDHDSLPRLKDLVSHWPLETDYCDKSNSPCQGVPNFISKFAGYPDAKDEDKPVFAYQFDGKESFIQSPLISTKMSQITMSAWFKSDNYSKPGQTIFYNGSDKRANGYGVTLNNEGDNQGVVRVLYGGILWFNTQVYVKDSKWHHVALVIRPDGAPELYLDSMIRFVGHSGQFPNMPTSYTEIGRNDYPAHRYFHGLIQHVAFWNTDLSQDEIKSVYHLQEMNQFRLAKQVRVYAPVHTFPKLFAKEKARLVQIRNTMCGPDTRLIKHDLVCSLCQVRADRTISTVFYCSSNSDYRECQACHDILHGAPPIGKTASS